MAGGVVSIPPGKLGAVLRARAKATPKATLGAMRLAAARAARHLVKLADESGVTDRGVYKNGWAQSGRDAQGKFTAASVKASGNEVTITNSAPYAGIIEMGARPHNVSPEGREAIRAWVIRKLGMDEKDADAVTWGIINKLKTEGQKGHFFVRDSLPTFAKWLDEEITRAIDRLYSKPVGGGSE